MFYRTIFNPLPPRAGGGGDDSCCHLGGAVIMKNNSQRSTINLPIIIDVQLSYRHKNTNDGVLDSFYEDLKMLLGHGLKAHSHLVLTILALCDAMA